MTFLLLLIEWLYLLYSIAIVARVVLPWLRVDYHHPAVRFLIQITEPLLAPLRRHIRPMGGWDITPMVALIILWVVKLVVTELLKMLVVIF